jgi:hypothetical protein
VFEERVSGPLEGDEEPFSSGRADIRFLCAPLYRWVRETRRPIELLPLPVPIDARAQGRPVYFADVVVRVRSSLNPAIKARVANALLTLSERS